MLVVSLPSGSYRRGEVRRGGKGGEEGRQRGEEGEVGEGKREGKRGEREEGRDGGKGVKREGRASRFCKCNAQSSKGYVLLFTEAGRWRGGLQRSDSSSWWGRRGGRRSQGQPPSPVNTTGLGPSGH